MGQQRVKSFDPTSGGVKVGKEQKEGAKKKKGKHVSEERAKEQMEKRAKETGKDVRYIVRIVNKDLDGTLPVGRALTSIKGINSRFAIAVAKAFEEKTGTSSDKLLGEVPEEQCKLIEEIVSKPTEYGIPEWMLNRNKDFTEGNSKHLVMADLDFSFRQDKQRLGNVKSYRGLRHVWKLPLRGQRTRSTHRGKGGAVGVHRKEAKK